jgi:hypothetical protein
MPKPFESSLQRHRLLQGDPMFGGRGQLSPNWPRFDNFPVLLSSNPKFGVLQQPLVSKPTVPRY